MILGMVLWCHQRHSSFCLCYLLNSTSWLLAKACSIMHARFLQQHHLSTLLSQRYSPQNLLTCTSVDWFLPRFPAQLPSWGPCLHHYPGVPWVSLLCWMPSFSDFLSSIFLLYFLDGINPLVAFWDRVHGKYMFWALEQLKIHYCILTFDW